MQHELQRNHLNNYQPDQLRAHVILIYTKLLLSISAIATPASVLQPCTLFLQVIFLKTRVFEWCWRPDAWKHRIAPLAFRAAFKVRNACTAQMHTPSSHASSRWKEAKGEHTDVTWADSQARQAFCGQVNFRPSRVRAGAFRSAQDTWEGYPSWVASILKPAATPLPPNKLDFKALCITTCRHVKQWRISSLPLPSLLL